MYYFSIYILCQSSQQKLRYGIITSIKGLKRIQILKIHIIETLNSQD